MRCQECEQKPATLHFTKIINGEKMEFHICESCAREKGEALPGAPNGFSIHQLLSGLLDFESPSPGKSWTTEQETARCSHCELSYTQFRKTGKFGCDHCYKAFAPRLDALFKRVHGNLIHAGKVPKRSGGKLQWQREMDQIKGELRQAIENEEFEHAAKLRDQVREKEQTRNKPDQAEGGSG